MFRVLVAGGTGFRDYARLRDTLDALLADRMPDVVILTAGGPGVAALAASYARSRGLDVRVVVGDSQRRPGSAREEQLAALVAGADAVVVVYEPGDARRVVELARRLKRPLHVIDPNAVRTRPEVPPGKPAGGLPD